MCVHVQLGHSACVEVRKQSRGVSSFPHLCPRTQTHVIRFGGKLSYHGAIPLAHHMSSMRCLYQDISSYL